MTIVGGRVVYEDGRCVLIDEQELLDEADARGASWSSGPGWRASTSPWHRRAFGVDVDGCSESSMRTGPAGRMSSGRLTLEQVQELRRALEGARPSPSIAIWRIVVCSSPLAGVGTPCRRPSSTISPLR